MCPGCVASCPRLPTPPLTPTLHIQRTDVLLGGGASSGLREQRGGGEEWVITVFGEEMVVEQADLSAQVLSSRCRHPVVWPKQW